MTCQGGMSLHCVHALRLIPAVLVRTVKVRIARKAFHRGAATKARHTGYALLWGQMGVGGSSGPECVRPIDR